MEWDIDREKKALEIIGLNEASEKALREWEDGNCEDDSLYELYEDLICEAGEIEYRLSQE